MDDDNSKNLKSNNASLSNSNKDKQQEFEKIIGSISKSFINIVTQDNFDAVMRESLAKIRELLDSDRVYVFEVSKDNKRLEYSYEVCAENIYSKLGTCLEIEMEKISNSFGELSKKSYVFIPDVDDISEEMSVEKELVKKAEIKSFVCFPIKKQNKVYGFYGIDGVNKKISWSDEEINLMQILADIFAWAYDKRQIQIKLLEIQQQKIQQQNFVSMVSHEFKTPLSIIDSSAQRILRKINTMEPSEIINRMERIRNSISRLNNLVETTLNLSKLDAGKLSINPSMNDLKDIVLSVIAEIKYVTPDRAINFEYSGNTVGIFDPHRLYLVINNLISNAIKYSAEEINVKCDDYDKYLRVSVTDKGYGLSEDDLKQMGSKFFRAKHTQDIPGTGVGVYLIKNIIEMHGGKFDIQSKLGSGSTFTVYLLKDFDFSCEDSIK
ncbi:MAG: ATP-binding protein [Alphaproteobacteria bacterium]